MNRNLAGIGNRSGGTAAVLLCGAVAMLALPSAVLAFSSRFDAAPAPAARAEAERFVPAEVDPRLARSITVRGLNKDRLFRFTPASTTSRADNPVTVAVRVDGNAALALRNSMRADMASGAAGLRIAPGAYSLGASRGYSSFAQSPAPTPASAQRTPDIPDLAAYTPRPGVAPDNSRFAPRIELDERQKTGRSPRTFEQSDQTVGLGGSYRLTRNIDVTAGVRVTSDRDRLRPLTDGRQDSQAVYVGTQFRF